MAYTAVHTGIDIFCLTNILLNLVDTVVDARSDDGRGRGQAEG